MTVRAFIVDSHELFRAGVRSALDDGAAFEVVGEAATFDEAVEGLTALAESADIVLAEFRVGLRLGAEMPALARTDPVRSAPARPDAARPDPARPDPARPDPARPDPARPDPAGRPGARGAFRNGLILVCDDVPGGSISAAVQEGVAGFVARDAGMDELRRVVELVAGGGVALTHSPAQRFTEHLVSDASLDRRQAFPDLTARQVQILDLLALGHDNRRIARRLVLSEKTVRNHVSNLFARLQVTTRAEAVAWARDAGLGRGRAQRPETGAAPPGVHHRSLT